MKRNPFFLYRAFGETEYLLPYGQAISDHMQSARINFVGKFIWDLLENDLTEDEIISRCAEEYEIEAVDMDDFAKDIRTFINELASNGAVMRTVTNDSVILSPQTDADSLTTPIAPETVCKVEIAGITLSLIGPKALYEEQFRAFLKEGIESADITVSVTADTLVCPAASTPLLINPEVSVWESSESFYIVFGRNKYITYLSLSRDGAAALYHLEGSDYAAAAEEMFHAIRLAFLYGAETRGMAALHSASLLYNGKAYLFSGHSGMGKSTHTNMWTEIVGTKIINGDLNLLCMENGVPCVKGIPWCGTSGMFSTETYPIGGIILLSRGTSNYVKDLSEDAKTILVSQRLISPSWKKTQYGALLDLCEQITSKILVCNLFCTKDPEAVAVMKEKIDAAG